MRNNDTMLQQLRSAAAGAAYTKELREILGKKNITGFPGRPAETEDVIRRTLMKLTIHLRFRCGKEIFHFLENERIPYAVVKGAVLSQRIYGDETSRLSGDVDILLPRKYADAVKDSFVQNGFQQGRITGGEIVPYTRQEKVFQATQSHQLAPFVCFTGNSLCPFVNYDLNVELFWGESSRHTDMEWFLCDTVPMTVGNVEVQTLTVEKEFAALCLHHYKDWNSVYLIAERGVPLSHFFDIYGYLLTQRPDAQKLRAVCDRLGATKYVYFCVQYVDELFGQPCTAEYLDTLKTPDGEELINKYGLHESEQRTWNVSLAERIFEDAFPARFAQLLTERDREIIRLNRAMM